MDHKRVGFTTHYQQHAIHEGWVLIYIPATRAFEIQKYDTKSPFADDVAARKWVRYNKRDRSAPWREYAYILTTPIPRGEQDGVATEDV